MAATANPQPMTPLEQELEILRGDEERLRIALETAQLGTWQFDFDTGAMESSAICKAHFGRRPEDDFTYDDLLEALHPEDEPERRQAMRKAIKEGSIFSAEYRIVWPDDSVHWIVAAGRALIGDITKPMRIIGVTLDATDRHLAAAALLQTEKLAAVGRLASSIAHEINNPLESVTNLLYLARHTENADERNEYLDIAERELRRASSITSQTLRFHKQSSSPRDVTAADLFEGVLTIFQGRLVNSQILVERRERTQKTITCFDSDIRQVLNNLVDNAIDALPPAHGRLLLRAKEATHWPTSRKGIVLTVADTGNGMTPRVCRRIFDPFFTTKGIGGTGLGLWISQEIMGRHEGTLRVRTRERTEMRAGGTVFTLFLPFEVANRPAQKM